MTFVTGSNLCIRPTTEGETIRPLSHWRMALQWLLQALKRFLAWFELHWTYIFSGKFSLKKVPKKAKFRRKVKVNFTFWDFLQSQFFREFYVQWSSAPCHWPWSMSYLCSSYFYYFLSTYITNLLKKHNIKLN